MARWQGAAPLARDVRGTAQCDWRDALPHSQCLQTHPCCYVQESLAAGGLPASALDTVKLTRVRVPTPQRPTNAAGSYPRAAGSTVGDQDRHDDRAPHLQQEVSGLLMLLALSHALMAALWVTPSGATAWRCICRQRRKVCSCCWLCPPRCWQPCRWPQPGR